MKIIIDELTTDKRLDVFLAGYLQDYSRSKIQNIIKSGKVLINNKETKPSYTTKDGDLIEISLDKIEEKQIIKPENIPIEVIWEDENMLVVNKPSGMLTHPTTTENTGTLVNALLYKYKEHLSDINGDFRRGIVHRLDRNTSGLLMIAKNNSTHEFLAEKIKNHEIKKTYRAFAKNIIQEDSLTINTPIGRNPRQPNKMAIIPVENGGKESLSIIHVIKRYKEATHIDIDLITGRTHQIRVHLSSIGHPIFNDTLYGFGKTKIKTEEQVLQSYKLSFIKPFTEERIELEIEPDEKFLKVHKALENNN